MGKATKKLKSMTLVLVFLLLAGLLIAAADAVLAPKSDITLAFKAEPKDSIDVLFVGGSHGASAFDPTQLWEEQGFTSYNFYSWGQPAWTTYHFIVEALKTQSPRVVVAEGFGFMYGRSYLDEGNFDSTSDDFSLQIPPGINRVQLAMAMGKWQVTSRSAWRYASLLRYHGRWKSLEIKDFTWPFTDYYNTHKGFGPVYTYESFAEQPKPESYPESTLYEGCEEYLRKLIALSEKEGFQLIIATAPYIIEDDAEWAVLDHMRRICEENGVAFLNYNDPALLADTGFSFVEDMAEHAHVNMYGAQKITAHIGQYLTDGYSLPDRRDDEAFAYWQEAAAIESRDKARTRLRLSPDAASWFTRLDQPDLVTFVVVQEGMDVNGDLTPLQEGLAAAGVPTFDLALGSLLVARIENGHVEGSAAEHSGGDVYTSMLETVAGREILLDTRTGITVDGELASLPYTGCHALVMDSATGEIVQRVVFLPEEGCITRTD